MASEKYLYPPCNYTDGQKKRYRNFCHVLHVAHKHELHVQAYHDRNLKSSLGLILICGFCLPGMLANIHVHAYILMLSLFFPFLVIYRHFICSVSFAR